MVYVLYDILLTVSGVFLLPFFAWKGFRRGKIRRGIRERFGFYKSEKLERLKGTKTIWVHSVSVGETRAAIPLLKALREEYPGASLLVTTVTETGQEIAGTIKEADLCLYFPFDLSCVVRRVLKIINPSVIIIVETEIWPNLVRLASDVGIPLLLVNGRLSDRSFPRYQKGKYFIRPVLEKFSAFCMQSKVDADRIRLIGAPEEKIVVTGNLKFDFKTPHPSLAETENFRNEFHLPSDHKILVCGSTHEGEEEELVNIYLRLLNDWPQLILILVPRHPGRCRSVGEMIRSHGVQFILCSQAASRKQTIPTGDILLGDTMGDMLKFYSLANIVFVGGSLVPVGGHNVLEASMVKKPVVFGSYMNNFKEISNLLLKAQAGICVHDKEELYHYLNSLLKNPNLREKMGENGYRLLEQNKGATNKTIEILKRILRP